MVAHEAPVIATGARTETSGKRELFKESTTTALVFPSGGVIRLSAAAAPGQLLFLTNPRNRREIVAQVTRRRNNPGSGYYIELEFTEPAADFWGLAFPETPAAEVSSTPSAPQAQSAEPAIAPAAVEFLQPAEPGSDDLSPNAPAPTAGEVHALVEEIEALRAQLKSMQTQNAKASVPGVPAMHLPAAPVEAQSATPAATSNPAAAPDLAAMLSSLVASSGPPQDHSSPDAHTPSAAPASSTARDELPPRPEPHPAHSDEALLPKPALDFQKAKLPPPNSLAHAPVAPPDRTGVLRLALLAVVSLFAVMVAAWNMHLLPWLAPKTAVPDQAASAAQPNRKPPAPTRPSGQPKPDAHAGSAPSPTAKNAPATAAPAPAASANVAGSLAAQPRTSDATDNSAPPTDAKPHSSRNADSAAAPITPVAKRSAVHDSQSFDTTASPSPSDGSITPPRLIKSVRAVAPGDALRQFMTGNVTLDAFVDKTGVVRSMKVLSGPPSFHKAAMDALKQYRYEPARQNGKPVSTHITVTIPFWFEP